MQGSEDEIINFESETQKLVKPRLVDKETSMEDIPKCEADSFAKDAPRVDHSAFEQLGVKRQRPKLDKSIILETSRWSNERKRQAGVKKSLDVSSIHEIESSELTSPPQEISKRKKGLEYDEAKLLENISHMLDQKLESKLGERKLVEREYFNEMKSDVIKLWQDQTSEFYKHIRSDEGSSAHSRSPPRSKEEPFKASSNMSMHTESLRNPSPNSNIRDIPKKVSRFGA